MYRCVGSITAIFPTDETDLANVSTRVTYDDTNSGIHEREVIKLLQLHTTITFTDLLKGLMSGYASLGFSCPIVS